MAIATCPKCDGTGWKIVERGGLSGAERCDCADTGRVDRNREKSNIPPNFANATLDNFDLPRDNPIARTALSHVLLQVKKFAREFPAVSPPGLLLVGNPGLGKTHLAVGIMKALLDRGHAPVFFTYQRLLDQVRKAWDSSSGTTDREAYGLALDADILVLDDLGAHRAIEWVEDTINAIMTHRCDHRKPLIATTNLPDEPSVRYEMQMPAADRATISRKSLPDMIGYRAHSRLHEMCRIIQMPEAADYRMQRRT